ncbi:MAG: hypothetical protein ACTSP3_01965 [Candidatus Heimdallarchaeaceae archaeon]
MVFLVSKEYSVIQFYNNNLRRQIYNGGLSPPIENMQESLFKIKTIPKKKVRKKRETKKTITEKKGRFTDSKIFFGIIKSERVSRKNPFKDCGIVYGERKNAKFFNTQSFEELIEFLSDSLEGIPKTIFLQIQSDKLLKRILSSLRKRVKEKQRKKCFIEYIKVLETRERFATISIFCRNLKSGSTAVKKRI